METMAQAAATAVKSHTSFEDRLQSLIAAGFKVVEGTRRLAFIGADETHSEMHSESPEHASILRAITDLFRDAVNAGEMEAIETD